MQGDMVTDVQRDIRKALAKHAGETQANLD
jgi:hypothetical protein